MPARTQSTVVTLVLVLSAACLVAFSPNALDQPVVWWTALVIAIASLVSMFIIRKRR